MSQLPPAVPAEILDLPPAPVDERGLENLTDAEATARAKALGRAARFVLAGKVTPLQRAYLDHYGYVVFDRVASVEEVEKIKDEVRRVQEELLAEGKRAVNGIPIWFGKDPDGNPFLQRLAFTSLFSDFIASFVRDARFEPVRQLVGKDARLGDREKDGVVMNRYVQAAGSLRPGLGWHTDGLRDVFYNWKLPGPQLNVGIHFERIRPEDGGLRILPGSHHQGLRGLLFRKPYFVGHTPDPDEVHVETWPGDLTVHDGRTWHRVQSSTKTGWASLRHSMYVPYVTDAYQPKDEKTKTMLYMRVFDAVLRLKAKIAG